MSCSEIDTSPIIGGFGMEYERYFQMELQKRKFEVISYEDVDPYDVYDKVLIKNAPWTSWQTLFKDNRKTEFVINIDSPKVIPSFKYAPDGSLRIRVDCKFQDVPGSTKDKIDGLGVHLLLGAYPEENAAIVMEGKQFSNRNITEYQEVNRALTHKFADENPKNILIMRHANFFELLDSVI